MEWQKWRKQITLNGRIGMNQKNGRERIYKIKLIEEIERMEEYIDE